MRETPAGIAMAIAVKPRMRERQDQDGERRHLDLVLLDLLAQIFGRAPDHQAGDEDREDGEDDQAIETRANAAEDDLAKLRCSTSGTMPPIGV